MGRDTTRGRDANPERSFTWRSVLVDGNEGVEGGPGLLGWGAHNRPLGKGLVQMARDGLVEPHTLLPVAVPDYLRFGMVRALWLFIAKTKFPAYRRIMSMPVPVIVVIGSEDPVRPSWRIISRAMAEIPPRVTIVLFQGPTSACGARCVGISAWEGTVSRGWG
jgi:hypothetical protein